MTMAAAMHCITIFFLGERPIRSSLIPKNMSVILAAKRESNLIRSVWDRPNTIPKKIRVRVKVMNMPTPPRVGVLAVCILRSTGSSIRFLDFTNKIITGYILMDNITGINNAMDTNR
jgi:hypothetical protein